MASTTLLAVETPVTLTPLAIAKVKEFVAQQNPMPAGLRIGVADGGCSGFSYAMSFENYPGDMDKVYIFDGLQIFVDDASSRYLSGCIMDYEDTPDGAGFTFENPNAKSACACGSSFNV